MEPISLAVLTAAVTTLATKATEAVGEEAGKSLWGRVKNALGWSTEPPKQDLPVMLARQFDNDKDLAKRVLALLNGQQGDEAGVRQLVGRIDAEKVVVSQTINVAGDFNM